LTAYSSIGAADFEKTFGWDNKYVGARILLSKSLMQFFSYCFFAGDMVTKI